MSKKVINQKLHKTLTSTDWEALFWVACMALAYFFIISVCYVGSLYV